MMSVSAPGRRHALGLSVALTIALATGEAQRSGDAADVTASSEAGLVGLVELPWIYEANGPPPNEPLTAHAAPDASARVVALLDRDGVRTPDGTRVCGWVRDLDRVSGSPPGCEFVEAGYEVPALRVYERRDSGWLLVNLTGSPAQSVWIRPGGRFHSIVDLLAGDGHLTYLDLLRWDRRMFQTPGGSSPIAFRHPALLEERQAPYEALGHAIHEGRVWLHVRILDDVCGARDPVEIGRGWIPAKTAGGELNAWFWSRGC
jgi:hypothetical protein